MHKTWLVVLALVVAGCSDKPEPPQEEDAPPSGFLEAEHSDASGSITGVVVDGSVRPIAGASVGVLSQGLNATTDAEGRFAFHDLAPGTYFLDVRASRHLPVQQSAQVKPGETTKLKVSLLHDGLPDPYKATQHFNGMIHFHATVAWALIEWTLDSELGITTPACDCAYQFTSDEKPQAHVYEAAWVEDTPPPQGGPSPYYWEYAVPDPFQEVYGYATSPVVRSWNKQPWPEETGTYKVLLLGPENWIAVEQSFEIFLTHWFNTDAPEGWAITNGDS